jgi:hypothetical protein
MIPNYGPMELRQPFPQQSAKAAKEQAAAAEHQQAAAPFTAAASSFLYGAAGHPHHHLFTGRKISKSFTIDAILGLHGPSAAAAAAAAGQQCWKSKADKADIVASIAAACRSNIAAGHSGQGWCQKCVFFVFLCCLLLGNVVAPIYVSMISMRGVLSTLVFLLMCSLFILL